MKKIIIAAAFIVGLGFTAQAQQSQNNGNEIKHKALLESGESHLEKGDYKKAIAVYNEALAYGVDTRNTIELRAMAFLLNKEYKAAIEDLDKLIEAGGDNVGKLYIARSSAKMGIEDSEGACIDLKQARELGHDVKADAMSEICGE